MAKDDKKGKEEKKPEPAAAAEGEGGKKKVSGLKIVLFVVLPLLVLILGGAAGAYFAGFLDPLLGKEKEETAQADGDKKAEGPSRPKLKGPGVMYDLPEMLINLNTGGRQASYIKLKVSLELADDPSKAKVNEVLPRVLDNFQTFVRELRVEDLQGSAGVYRLKEELLLRVNASVQPVIVYDVLFREMLVH